MINAGLVIIVLLFDYLVAITEEKQLGWIRSHYYTSIFSAFLQGNRPDTSEYLNDITKNLPEISSIIFSLFRNVVHLLVLGIILIVTLSIDTKALIFCLIP